MIIRYVFSFVIFKIQRVHFNFGKRWSFWNVATLPREKKKEHRIKNLNMFVISWRLAQLRIRRAFSVISFFVSTERRDKIRMNEINFLFLIIEWKQIGFLDADVAKLRYHDRVEMEWI